MRGEKNTQNNFPRWFVDRQFLPNSELLHYWSIHQSMTLHNEWFHNCVRENNFHLFSDFLRRKIRHISDISWLIDNWIMNMTNCCPWYPRLTAITVKCWHVFGVWIWTIFPPTGNVFRLDSSPETMFSTIPPQIQLLSKQTPLEENIWLRKQAIMPSVQLLPSSPTPFVQYLFQDITLNL